ncbi:hypothetical protein Pla52o_32050 [Novipirellula galeiformis]|uniref:Uncharacterized protein n=1 Tax=Novipirellula galeiformis TaxID=2528004 RepID=A0A5C6CDD3_9BACT|nr:hypothetical protein [Novipirellula galeiformis]TWU22152.1 hypothetical protein Pla52o_32050 [Novipirellula galeiformis]
MIINGIILFVTLMMVGFVAVWLLFPATRDWFEAPKYRFMENQGEDRR